MRHLWLCVALVGVIVPWASAATGRTVNVTSYGARGDGVADDRAAIQQAIDAVAAAGGGTVILPAGVFRVVAPPKEDRYYPYGIRLASNVALTGAGEGSVIKLDPVPPGRDTVWLLATCDRREPWCDGPTTNVRIENLTIDGSLQQQPRLPDGRISQHMHGIMISFASQVQIRRVTVRDVAGDGVYTYRENDRIVVERSTFQRIRRVAINFAGTNDSIARDNVITGAQWALKMELDGPAERSVGGNEFRRNTAREILGGISVTASDEMHLPTRARAARIVIAENDFEITSDRVDRIGILLWGVDGVQVTGNRVHGNIMQGLTAWDDVSQLTIDGNVFAPARGSPGPAVDSAACIRLGGRDAGIADLRAVTIRNNTLQACRVGIWLARPGRFQLVNATISANTFIDNRVAGIFIDSASGIVNLSIGPNTFRQTPNPVVRR